MAEVLTEPSPHCPATKCRLKSWWKTATERSYGVPQRVPHAGSACGPACMLCPSDAQDQAKAVGDLGEDVTRDMSGRIGLDELAADRAHLRYHCNGVLSKS